MVKVKRIMIKQIASATNFGKIMIHDVSGSVNIGTSYEGDFSSIIQKKIKDKLGKKIIDPSPFEEK